MAGDVHDVPPAGAPRRDAARDRLGRRAHVEDAQAARVDDDDHARGARWRSAGQPVIAPACADGDGGARARPALELLRADPAVGQDDHAVVGGAGAARVLGQRRGGRASAPVSRVELDEHVAVDRVDEAVAVGEHDAGVAPLPGGRRSGIRVRQRWRSVARVEARDVAALGRRVGAVAVDVELVAAAGDRVVGRGDVRASPQRDRRPPLPGQLLQRARSRGRPGCGPSPRARRARPWRSTRPRWARACRARVRGQGSRPGGAPATAGTAQARRREERDRACRRPARRRSRPGLRAVGAAGHRDPRDGRQRLVVDVAPEAGGGEEEALARGRDVDAGLVRARVEVEHDELVAAGAQRGAPGARRTGRAAWSGRRAARGARAAGAGPGCRASPGRRARACPGRGSGGRRGRSRRGARAARARRRPAARRAGRRCRRRRRRRPRRPGSQAGRVGLRAERQPADLDRAHRAVVVAPRPPQPHRVGRLAACRASCGRCGCARCPSRGRARR